MNDSITPTMLTPELIDRLRGIVGPAHALTDRDAQMPYLREWRDKYEGHASIVLRPRTTDEVAQILALAHEHRIPVVPQAGNTGLVGGQIPTRGEMLLSVARIDRVRAVDAPGFTMTVEAGVTLAGARAAADAADRLFPLSLPSEGTARIGGNLAINAGGVAVLAYGNARQLVLGLEVVLADGRIWDGLRGLKKDNTGYDLKDLLVGAEGTLGIITAAVLKLFPQPAAHETALVNVASPAEALTLFLRLRERAGTTLTVFELLPRFGIDLQLKHKMIERDPAASLSPWYALVEISVPRGGAGGVLPAGLEAALTDGLVDDAVIAESLADRGLMWTMREQMSDVQSREGASIKHDVSVPIAAVPELIAEGSAAAERLVPGIRPCPFGHMGDGNIHFNFSQPAGANGKAFMAGAEPIHAAIYEIVTRLGGSISAEHGIGQLRTELLKTHKDPVALDMMRAIKKALDPQNILNPGKVLD
jgi:FAD/FMN-containing dehydrogenase